MDIKVNENVVVCFDLDDTLYNELDYLRSAYKEIAQHVAGSEAKQLFAKMFSLYRKKENVFEYLVNAYKIDIQILIALYRNHNPAITLFSGALELIKAIKAKNGKLVIITDGRSISQRNKLKALGVLNYFDEVIISEEIGTEKPSLQNFKNAADKYPNCQYIYVGDNFKKDFVTPNSLDWLSVGLIDNGKNIHNNTFDYADGKTAPKALVYNLSDITIL